MKNKTVILLVVGVFIASLFTQIPQNFIKRVQLLSFYSKLSNYEKNSNYRAVYGLLSPDYKRKMTLDNFLQQRNQTTEPHSSEFIIHSYKVEGNKGLIDRTLIICDTAECSGAARHEQRAHKEYIYISGKWYVPEENTIYCTRNEPYNLAPEFERAVSLIIQRLSQGDQNIFLDEEFKSIKNCLYITYSTEVDAYDAEGLFYFDRNSTSERLNILVSNKYRANDDILTAILLTHEITHALIFTRGANFSCYENEAEAFFNQLLFVAQLNSQEKNSLTTRRADRSSEEINELFYLINSVSNVRNSTIFENILALIKQDPYYQKQCAGN